MHATLGQCALEENGVEVRDWYDCGISKAARVPYDSNESLNEVSVEYEQWLASLQIKGR
jgi:hypothetical protein